MRVLVFTAIGLLMAAAATFNVACSSDPATAPSSTAIDGGGDGGGAGSIPDPSTLFDSLPAPTPNRLRCVWESRSEQTTGTVAVRLRFTDDFIAVGVRCTPKTGEPVDVPDIEGVQSSDLDAAMGSFDFGGISVAGTTDAGVQCGTELPGGTINFKIDGLTMTLSITGSSDTISFTKVGD